MRTGWGLVAGHSSRPVLIDCGEISLPEKEPFPGRLRRLQVAIEDLLPRLSPDLAAVESPFHGVSARSALQLAHARGVILAALAGARIPVLELTPAEIKKAVTGNGRAEKDQVRRMVAAILGDPAAAGGADLSDALAAAICGISVGAFREAIERTGPGQRPGRG